MSTSSTDPHTAADALPADPGPEGSAYAALGGAPAVRALVDDFYLRVTGDGRLAPFFDGVDLARLKRHQVLVLGGVLGGPGGYDGIGLEAAHAGLGISPADYARVGEHLLTAFRDAGASDAVVEAVTATLAALQSQIVTADDPGPGGADGSGHAGAAG